MQDSDGSFLDPFKRTDELLVCSKKTMSMWFFFLNEMQIAFKTIKWLNQQIKQQNSKLASFKKNAK